MDLRVRLEQGQFDLDAVREFAVAEGDPESPEQVTDDDIKWAIRTEYSIPDELTDRRAEDVFRVALANRLELLGETEAGHPAACHLHDEAVETEPVSPRTKED
jgi:peptide/nickel transport system ATP-binding protein